MENNKTIIFNRWALFIVYFWFGILKVLNLSPAHQLVTDLAKVTLQPFISVEQFVVFFGVFECILGILWLFPKYTKIAFWLLAFHLATTFLPLVFLPGAIWQKGMVPNLVGQYIIKNLVLLGSALAIYTYKNKISQLS